VTVLLVALGAGVLAAIVAFAVSAAPALESAPPSLEHESEVARRAIRRWLSRHPRLRRFVRQRLDRTSAGGFLLTCAFLVVDVVATLLGLLLALIDDSGWMRDVDARVARWGADHASTTSAHVIRLVTNLGATPVVLAVLALTAAADQLRRRHETSSGGARGDGSRRRPRGEVFLFVAAVGIGEVLLNNGVKLLVRRERPDVLHLMAAHGYSFPSGHTGAAAAAWAAVALVLGRDRPRLVRSLLAAGAVLVAIVVATSRALLGVHWVSDVLGGLALGWGWFVLVAIVFGGRRQRIGAPVEGLAAPGSASTSTGHDGQARERTREQVHA
jgi:undecaprenyl-diphosphatase